MDIHVEKSKEISSEKALEKLERFLSKNAAHQQQALQQAAAKAEFEQAGGDDEAAAALGTSFVQNSINHLSPDIYFQLSLMRDALKKELAAPAKNADSSDDDE